MRDGRTCSGRGALDTPSSLMLPFPESRVPGTHSCWFPKCFRAPETRVSRQLQCVALVAFQRFSTLFDAVLRCSTLFDAVRRCSTLRRFSTLRRWKMVSTLRRFDAGKLLRRFDASLGFHPPVPLRSRFQPRLSTSCSPSVDREVKLLLAG